ncbi:MAG: arabinose efflux permease family protein [Clostridia bacterium]|nr:arabinose efflux permease family protein [Clostridia bacterium]
METQVASINQEVVQKEKLWTWNFFLLWQGQLVSAFGDIAYSMALGFWIYAKTGSTALMGTLMAVSLLPRIIISPFAGVWVDRSDRKKMIVWMDFIRGIVAVLVGVAAIAGVIEIWMVFAAGIILGICAAFFNPAVSSVIPDVVPTSKVMQANSAFNMIYSGTSILGNPIGGVVYQMLGAPIMFLFNGISYIFSAATEVFIKVPKIQRKTEQLHFFEDMKQGFKFMWKFKGLRSTLMIAAGLNLFANTAMVLMMPFFQMTKGLGPGKYGFAIALFTGGSFVGMLVTSSMNIKPKLRYMIFILTGLISSAFFTAFPLSNSLLLIVTLLFLAGLLNAILNVLFQTTIQLAVPQEMRGKVFSMMGTILMGLTPIGMALGGVMAEFIAARYVMSICSAITFCFFIPFIFMPSFKRFINYNPEEQTLEDIV